MEFVRTFFIVVVSLFVLYFLTGFADDLRYQVAGFYELLGQRDAAINAYLSIIADYSPTIEASRAALVRLDPARFKSRFGEKEKKKKTINIKKNESSLNF